MASCVSEAGASVVECLHSIWCRHRWVSTRHSPSLHLTGPPGSLEVGLRLPLFFSHCHEVGGWLTIFNMNRHQSTTYYWLKIFKSNQSSLFYKCAITTLLPSTTVFSLLHDIDALLWMCCNISIRCWDVVLKLQLFLHFLPVVTFVINCLLQFLILNEPENIHKFLTNC